MTTSVPKGHVKLIGDLLSGERSLGAKHAVGANQRYDSATRPRLRPAVTDDTKATAVGEDLPHRLGGDPPRRRVQ